VENLFGAPLDLRLLAVVAAVLIGGFMRGFVGFGGALVTVPVLSVVWGPQAAVAITSVMGIPSLFQLLPEAVRYSERPIVIPVALTTLLTAPIGSWVLVSVDPRLMSVVISGLVIAMVAMLAQGWTAKTNIGLPALIGAGAAGGLIQGAAGIGGPPVVAVALARGGSPKQQRANVLALMTAIASASLLPLWYFGVLTRHVLILGVLLFPLYVAATMFGSRYFSRGGHRHYRHAALTTLAVIAVATLVTSLRSYFAA
jgi:uncharacterized membrane protein YfcA